MLADLGVDGYLQGHEEEFSVQSAREQPEHRAFPESTEHLAPCRAQPGKHLRQPQAAVMSIAREPGTPDGGGDVIQGCPQSRVPERVADVEFPFVWCARKVAIELCPAWNPRIAVDAKLLEGNEVGPDVALFESANPDTMLLRDSASHPVNRPAVAEQQHDVDPPLLQETGEELRPVAGMATPGQRVGWIKQAVAAVEVDLVNLGARRSQEFREASEEGPHGALQQQDPLGVQRVPAGVAHGRATVSRNTARRRCCQARFGVPAASRHASSSSSACSALRWRPVRRLA